MSRGRLAQRCARAPSTASGSTPAASTRTSSSSAAPARPWTASCSATAACPRASSRRTTRLVQPPGHEPQGSSAQHCAHGAVDLVEQRRSYVPQDRF
eukprot:13123153-Alexandrium_andersonii.AAC.1